MKITSYNTVNKNTNGNAHSVQDIGALLGKNPHNLGLAATLFSQNDSVALLDMLGNVHQLPVTRDKYKPVTDLEFRWQLSVNKIKQVEITRTATTSGTNGQTVTIYLAENHYQPYDVFSVEGSRDHLWVLTPPVLVGPGEWEYSCRYVTEDLASGLDLTYAIRGNTTRYRYNIHPEGSDIGYVKQDSNVELHNNFLSLIRHDCNVTGQYAIQEQTFLQVGNPKSEKGVTYYKLDPAEKLPYKNFYNSRAESILFGKRTVSAQGKALLQDNKGRDIYSGDGIVTQAERHGERFSYSSLTMNHIEEAIVRMRQKAQKGTGNQFVMICNEIFERHFYRAAKDFVKSFGDSAPVFYSKQKGGKMVDVSLGANFKTYNWGGNTLSIVPERAMTHEYPDRGYGIVLNLTKDQELDRPAIELFTLEGASMITGNLKGLGGNDGQTSGDISSPVHGHSHIVAGYCGAALYAPYNTFIFEESNSTFI